MNKVIFRRRAILNKILQEKAKYNLAYRNNRIREIKKIRESKFNRLESKHHRKKCSCFETKRLFFCGFVYTKLSQHRI